tara:strand:- start:4803 stop:5081 length:279 start_codon:yes stop_codon:yes gene_type:complete
MKSKLNWISDLQWCIDNDWQVYLVPGTFFDHRVAIRKGGITSQGKDYRCDRYGIEYYSSEIVGSKSYRTQQQAMEGMQDVYKQLRKKYEITL